MIDNDELTRRLRAMSIQTLPPATRDDHLQRLRDELDRRAHVSTDDLSVGINRRSWLLAAAAVAVISGTVAVLAVARSALPGDGLYGTKLAIERIVSVADDDVAARHRIEELEALIIQRAEPDVIVAAQKQVSKALGSRAPDDPLLERQQTLVLGTSSAPTLLAGPVDWDGGQSFASSLPDGELIFVNRRTAGDGAHSYELSVGGDWTAVGRSDRWEIFDETEDGAIATAPLLIITADADSVSVVSRPSGDGGSSDDATRRSSGSDTGRDPASVRGGAAGADPAAAQDATTASNPGADTSVTTPSTASPGSTTTAPAPTTTSTIAKPTTTTTTRPPTTTTSKPTTTTATTRPSTTTTTIPTTTTRGGGDDDDD